MTTQLTKQQSEAKDKIFNWLNSEDSKFFLLSGYAGTGKTFLCGNIIQSYGKSLGKICVAAPTHKAKSVIESVFVSMNVDATFMTLHKLLGIRPELTEDGDEVFARDPKVKCTVNEYNLLIVDESSMISHNLWNWILIESEIKILFLGDPAQLPPVNEDVAMPFKVIEEHNRVLLTDVVRYDSGIAELALEIRTKIDHPKLIAYLDVAGYLDNAPEIIMLGRQEFEEEIKQQAKDYPMELRGNEPFKVMAWTNKVVDNYNKIMRYARYGINAKEFEEGEIIVCRKPYSEHNNIIFPTATELKIVSVYKLPEQMRYEGLPSYRLEVSDGERLISVEALSNLGINQYWGRIDEIKKMALNTQDSEERTKKWYRFFKLKEHFINVRSIFASTIHTMQGSGVDKAFVILDDIDRNEKVKERNQLLYTAITRAKKQVIVLKRWQYS